MFRKLVMGSLIVLLAVTLIPAGVSAQEPRAVQVTIWNGGALAWRYYNVDTTTTVELYYYWYAQTEQQVQDFVAHADFEITLDGEPLFASQTEVDALWEPINQVILQGKTYKRAEWFFTLPQLAPGEHTVHTTISIDAPISDGVRSLPYPAGILHNTTNIITVIEGLGGATVSPAQPAATARPRPGTPPTEIHSQPVVGTFIDHAYAYWGPDDSKFIEPPIVFHPGTTLWVFGMDATYSYYKVLLDAAYIWVHAETLGTTRDDVWNDDPLPNVVVE